MKKRKKIAVVYFIMICCLLIGCGSQAGFLEDIARGYGQNAQPGVPGVLDETVKGARDVSQKTDGSTAQPEATTASSGIPEKSQVKNLPPASLRVCLVGNSLIEYGNQAAFLEDIAWGYGQNIKVDQFTWGGMYLRDYCGGRFLHKNKLKRKLKKADIVVFQDYGGWQGKSTVRSIKKLEKWCKKKAKFYYYMYEGDDYEMSPSDYRKLKQLKLSFIPKGQMIDSMYGFGYQYDELHVEGDFHPNSFDGYLSALLMHAVLFERKCVEFPREWFPDQRPKAPRIYKGLVKYIHGDTKEERWEEFQRICRKLDELTVQAGSIRDDV